VGREIGVPPCSFTIRIKSLLFFSPRVIAIVLLKKIFLNIIMKSSYDKSIKTNIFSYWNNLPLRFNRWDPFNFVS